MGKEQLKYGQTFELLGVAVVMVRNKQGKYLALRETKGRGWNLPAGRVDPPEDFFTAAIRETKEESGIDVRLTGILRFEYSNYKNSNYMRLRVVFLAEPIDENQIPKQIPDKESMEARFVSLNEFKEFDKSKDGIRCDDFIEIVTYLEKGGLVYPLSILNTEGSKMKIDKLVN